MILLLVVGVMRRRRGATLRGKPDANGCATNGRAARVRVAHVVARILRGARGVIIVVRVSDLPDRERSAVVARLVE